MIYKKKLIELLCVSLLSIDPSMWNTQMYNSM